MIGLPFNVLYSFLQVCAFPLQNVLWLTHGNQDFSPSNTGGDLGCNDIAVP